MPTKTQALDKLIDVLAGENIETKGTVADVIDTLANMIESGAISLGGGYDLVISGTAHENMHSWLLVDLSVASGSIEECERKCIAGEPVNAVLVLNEQYNDYKFSVYSSLVSFNASYMTMTFLITENIGTTSAGKKWNIFYDSDYELTGFDEI